MNTLTEQLRARLPLGPLRLNTYKQWNTQDWRARNVVNHNRRTVLNFNGNRSTEEVNACSNLVMHGEKMFETLEIVNDLLQVVATDFHNPRGREALETLFAKSPEITKLLTTVLNSDLTARP